MWGCDQDQDDAAAPLSVRACVCAWVRAWDSGVAWLPGYYCTMTWWLVRKQPDCLDPRGESRTQCGSSQSLGRGRAGRRWTRWWGRRHLRRGRWSITRVVITRVTTLTSTALVPSQSTQSTRPGPATGRASGSGDGGLYASGCLGTCPRTSPPSIWSEERKAGVARMPRHDLRD